MKKLLTYSFYLFFLIACESNEGIVFDVENGQAIVSFNATSQVFPVSDAGTDAALIVVGVTTRSSVARAISLTVDPASTADPSEYTIDQASLVIPAGSFTGTVRIIGNFNAIPETGTTKLILKLGSVEGSTLDNQRLTHEIQMFRFCPFEGGATFLGEYQLSIVQNGIFDTPTFTPATVTVSQGANVAERTVRVAPYPAFGSFAPITFKFSLICGQVIVSNGQATGVGCGSSTTVGAGDVAATYNPANDSEILINISDDEGGASCGEEVQAVIKLTKL